VRFWLLQNVNSVDYVDGSTVLSPNVWYHIAGVADGAQMRVYVNGMLDGSKPSTWLPYSSPEPLQIGGVVYGGTFYSYFAFNGLIDEVRISAVALYGSNFTPQPQLSADVQTKTLWKFDGQTANDSSGNGNNGSLMGGASFSTDVPAAKLVAQWKFDEGSGTTVADTTGNGNTGILQGASWNDGVSCCTLNFDGISNKINIASNSSVTSLANTFTLAFWAYPRSPHEIDAESATGVGGASGQRYAWGPSWYNTASGQAGIGVSVGTNGVSVYEHADSYMPATLVYQSAINGWTHIAVVYVNKQPRLYINGVLVRVGLTSSKNLVRITPSDLGGMTYGYFDGQLKDARIYNGALSTTEVQAIGSISHPLQADVGGPYSGNPMQGIQFNGGASSGPIATYTWDFGDGTSGTGITPMHTYAAVATYNVTLTVADSNGASNVDSTTVSADAATPIHLNFEDLSTGVDVPTSYRSDVVFSSENDYFHPVHTSASCGFCITSSSPNFITSGLGANNGNHEVILDFKQPVKNLSFYVAALDNNGVFAQVDFWENGSYARTIAMSNPGAGQYYPLFYDWSSKATNITKVRIHDITDAYGIGFDDFDYTPIDVQRIDVTNPRITGALNATTQNALLGADVSLQSSIAPSSLTGGSYTWTITGSPQIVSGATNQASLKIRWLQPGTYSAKVTYVRNGVTVFGAVNVNVLLPTLDSFTYQASPDQVTRDRHCSVFPNITGARYSVGCYQYLTGPNFYGPDEGMVFTARAHIPSVQYISDPAQSGIKIKQYVSTFRKGVKDTSNGNFQCITMRISQDQVDTGWQLDGSEAMTSFVHAPPKFSQGNSLSYTAFDAPSAVLDSTLSGFEMYDVLLVDDRFQAYVDYFVGDDPLHPIFQRPLKLATENSYSYTYIGWKWSGQANFGADNAVKYQLKFTHTPSAFVAGTNVLPTLQGNVTDTYWGQCAGDPAPSTNMIDGARCFVIQQYWDFYNRAPEQGGLDFWTSQIAKCEFDRNCINSQRDVVANEFFKAAEFQQFDPAMANPPGSANFNPAVYNPAFVRHCYNNFLRRIGEQEGIDFWTDVLNQNRDYVGVIHAFITSDEYRNRINASSEGKKFHSCS
jgi:PKD repeat protein